MTFMEAGEVRQPSPVGGAPSTRAPPAPPRRSPSPAPARPGTHHGTTDRQVDGNLRETGLMNEGDRRLCVPPGTHTTPTQSTDRDRLLTAQEELFKMLGHEAAHWAPVDAVSGH
ncbi:putative ADP-ribosylation factor-like protein 5C [Manis javanica]|nr:putative ADP-ribosylation factor-like protein 5C [Manis javanica]